MRLLSRNEIVVVALVMVAPPAAGEPMASEASFTLRYRDEVCPYGVTAVFAMPRETLTLSVRGGTGPAPDGAAAHDGARFAFGAPSCESTSAGLHKWAVRCPAEPGSHRLRILDTQAADSMIVHLFVMVPMSAVHKAHLNGYRIGQYPKVALHGLEIYRPPRGFVEVTPENVDTPVSPHFTLGQFLCKQESDYPKYLVLRERLLYKLEALLKAVNVAGYSCPSFQIMSGYRTPHYNEAIGNVAYSRHLWGGAADVFVDTDGDGTMDDLNRDGRYDIRDAQVLYNVFDGMYGQSWYERFVGGLAVYRKTSARGAFVHVDVRGRRARW